MVWEEGAVFPMDRLPSPSQLAPQAGEGVNTVDAYVQLVISNLFFIQALG
jgi:hypothetical protein